MYTHISYMMYSTYVMYTDHLPNPILEAKKNGAPLALPWVTRLQQSFPASPLKPGVMRI